MSTGQALGMYLLVGMRIEEFFLISRKLLIDT
jgi:hypothetical protein